MGLVRFVLATSLLLAGCGAVDKIEGRSSGGGSSTPAGADATVSGDQNPALIQSLTTPAVTACHQSGFVYLFSSETCSTTLKLATWPCTRSGIEAAFAPTGLPIDQALALSLDHDGYVIDECGQSAGGEIYAELVQKNQGGTLQVRELEAQQ